MTLLRRQKFMTLLRQIIAANLEMGFNRYLLSYRNLIKINKKLPLQLRTSCFYLNQYTDNQCDI